MKLRAVLTVALIASAGCQKKSTAPPAPDAATKDVAEAPAAAAAADGVEIPVVTKHVETDGTPKFTNELAKTASRYLLRMAHSPVDFAPWDDMAFRRAAGSKRLVLVSIGSDDCAPCAELATGAFDDAELAKAINDRYVALAVDAHERPLVASFYADAAKAMGAGSLPLTVWATPEGNVVRAVSGPPVIADIKDEAAKFQANAAEVMAAAKKQTAAARQARAGWTASPVKAKALVEAAHKAGKGAESASPAFIQFMFRASQGEDSRVADAMRLLDAAVASRYDVVGGGFFSGPAFEKNAADNAAFLRVLTEAWQRTQNPTYRRLAEGTAEFLLRDLIASNGGFYARLKPTSKAFYAWNPDKLGAHASATVALDDDGIPRWGESVEKVAQAQSAKPEEFEQELKKELEALRVERAKRSDVPHLDDRVLTRSVASTFDALAYAGFVFVKDEWVSAAEKAALALPSTGPQLHRSGIPGRLGPEATADDLAETVSALLTLFEASTSAVHMRRALFLQSQLEAKFGIAGGGYAQWPTSTTSVLGPMIVKESAANDLSVGSLLRIDTLREDKHFAKRRAELWDAVSGLASEDPVAHGAFLTSTLLNERPMTRVAVVGAGTEPLLDVLRSGYFPQVVLGRPSSVNILPWVMANKTPSDQPAAFVCEESCSKPIREPRLLARELVR